MYAGNALLILRLEGTRVFLTGSPQQLVGVCAQYPIGREVQFFRCWSNTQPARESYALEVTVY